MPNPAVVSTAGRKRVFGFNSDCSVAGRGRGAPVVFFFKFFFHFLVFFRRRLVQK